MYMKMLVYMCFRAIKPIPRLGNIVSHGAVIGYFSVAYGGEYVAEVIRKFIAALALSQAAGVCVVRACVSARCCPGDARVE
jgi:hypothetical protein